MGGLMAAMHAPLAQALSSDSNVILIILEDVNDWVGCLGGHPDARTPHIDNLAKRGQLFSNAHVSATICVPSRTSFLSGLKPSTTGVYDNTDPWEDRICSLATLPGYLRSNGYRTYQGGKIFHGGYPSVWDDAFPHRGDPTNPRNPASNLPSPSRDLLDFQPLDISEEKTYDYQVTDWAIDRIRKHPADQPYFLAINYFRAHLPWYVPRHYYEQFDPAKVTLPPMNPDDLDDIPSAGRSLIHSAQDKKIERYQQRRAAVSAYLSGMYFADAMLGRLLTALDSEIFNDNTILLLCSDHGFHLGEKSHWKKSTLWEESTHVPLIVIAPGVTTPGSVCTEAVSLLDMYPTINGLTGLPCPPYLEGLDLTSWLLNPDLPRDEPALTTYHAGNHAIRTRRWRYIRYADGSEELYDHDSDPHEWTNLAGQAQYRDLMDELVRWMLDDGPQPDAGG